MNSKQFLEAKEKEEKSTGYVPLQKDVLYKAQKEFPGYSDQSAVLMYLASKMDTQKTTDTEQNRQLSLQKQENDKLKSALFTLGSELDNHEAQAAQTDQEVERLKQLSAKLKPAGEITQTAAKVAADELQKLEAEIQELKNKPGIDDQKFKELSTKVNSLKTSPSFDNKELDKLKDTLSKISSEKTVSDDIFDNVMGELERTRKDLDAKEERFKKYIQKKGRETQERTKTSAEELKKYADIVDSYKEKIDALDSTIDNTNKKSEELYTKAWATASAAKKQTQNLLDVSAAQDVVLNNLLNLVSQLSPEVQQKITPSVGKLKYASDVAHSDVALDDPEIQQAKIPPEPVSGEELTGEKGSEEEAKKAASDLISKMRGVKESMSYKKIKEAEEEKPLTITETAINMIYPIYIRKYPGDLHTYGEAFIARAMSQSIWTGLLVYVDNDDFDEKYIHKYIDRLHERIKGMKPKGSQPEFKEVPSQAPKEPENKLSVRNVGPFYPGIKESKTNKLVNEYQKYLDKLSGGF